MTQPQAELRRERNFLLLAGVLLLLCTTVYAAHEPEPVLDTEGIDLNAQPAPEPVEQQQLVPWGTLKQQQQQQEKPPRQPEAKESPLADPAAGDAGDAAPPTSPAPHMATILPLMPMVLPGCPFDNILDSNKAWDFPKNWASMTTEQQALHPINLLLMNMVGVPSTDLLSLVNPCLHSWGVVKGSVTKIVKDYKVGNSMTMKTIVLVFRTKTKVWVVFRPTDDDWAADFDCMYTGDLRKKLNVPTPPLGAPKLQLHRGFWSAYLAVDKQLMQEVNKQLKLVKTSGLFGKPQVWFAGHSLGGALASIAAFRMAHDPWFGGEVAAVVTYGSPRVGNEVWQTLYQEKLMDKTLRWSNHRDLFAALPAKGQFCLSSSPLKTVFSFRHVGKAVLLCPSTDQPGLQEFKFFPKGTETSCNTGETLIIGTHLLGHYFDGWRRAYAHRNGLAAATMLSGGPHVRSVMCGQCALAVKQYPLPDNKAARNDGVVSCVDNKSCNDKELFSVVSWAGLFPTAFFRSDAVCDGATALCQVPSAALTQVQNKLLEIAPNLTAAVGALASKAFQNNPVSQFFTGMAGINMTSFMAAYNGQNTTAGSGGIGAGAGAGAGQQQQQQQQQHNGGKAGGAGEEQLEEEPLEDGGTEEDAPAEGESAAARTAALGGIAVSGLTRGGELVVEPSMDGDILMVTPAAGQDTDNRSSNSNSSVKSGAGSAPAAAAPAGSSNNSSSSSSNGTTVALTSAGSPTTQVAAAVANSSAPAGAAGEGAGEDSEEGEEEEEEEAVSAKPASRPKVLDVVGGFVARASGFLSHLQSVARAQ